MTAPLVVSFWMRAAFTFVDTAYAATIGDPAVAAIGLAVPFEFVMIAVWVGLSTGLTSCLSTAMGERDQGKIRQYLTAARRLVLAVAPAFLAIGLGIWILAPRMELTSEVSRAFQVYGTVLVAGSALSAFWSIIPDSLVKAHQDTRATMWAGIASNVANVSLNTLFTFVFGWGVFGIALSTVIGRFAGLAYALSVAARHERRRLEEWDDAREGSDPHPYRALLKLAVPSSISFALMSAETAIVNRILAVQPHATASIAAYSIYYRVMLFALNPCIALGVAMLPYAARRFGRGDFDDLRRGLRQAYLACTIYSVLLVGPAMLLAGPPLARWLGESPVTVEYASTLLKLVPLATLLGAPFVFVRPVFEGMQRGRPGLVMAVVRYGLLSGPLAWGLSAWAPHLGLAPIHGVVAGVLLATAIASSVFSAWLGASLPQAGPPAAAPSPSRAGSGGHRTDGAA
jgi:putative MATE family efflux protein